MAQGAGPVVAADTSGLIQRTPSGTMVVNRYFLNGLAVAAFSYAVLDIFGDAAGLGRKNGDNRALIWPGFGALILINPFLMKDKAAEIDSFRPALA